MYNKEYALHPEVALIGLSQYGESIENQHVVEVTLWIRDGVISLRQRIEELEAEKDHWKQQAISLGRAAKTFPEEWEPS